MQYYHPMNKSYACNDYQQKPMLASRVRTSMMNDVYQAYTRYTEEYLLLDVYNDIYLKNI